MPLTVTDGAALGAGMLCVSGAAMFYRAKKTGPFKLAYFLSWPVLGSAIIYSFSPDKDKMEKELRQDGLMTADQMEANRKLTQLQLDQLKHVAQESKKTPGWPEEVKR